MTIQRKAEWIECDKETYPHFGYWQEPAPKAAVDYILQQKEETESFSDGRSQWIWIRLPDGDLVLAVYPQGDTYFATEHWCTI